MTRSNPSSAPLDDVLLATGAPSSVVVCSIYEDQRPLKGAAGALDWRLRGFLSRFVKDGRISGEQDEVVYIPFIHHETMRHLLLVGLGPTHGSRALSPAAGAKIVDRLAEAVKKMHFKRVVISRSSFPFEDEIGLKKALPGVEVEFTQ